MDGEVEVRNRGDGRREAILRTARDVFLQDGYGATSMSAIAARVGGSKGTLYNHFKSKEELFVAVMQEVCRREAEEAFSFDGYDGDVGAALHRLGVRYVKLILSEPMSAMHRVVIAEGARFPELGRAFYDAGPKVSRVRLAAFLAREAGAGRLRIDDFERAAGQFLELAKAGLHQRRLWTGQDVTPDEIESAVASAVTVFMAAYGPKPSA